MRADFSRIRFNRRKNYTAVLEQQGRVALDADANEQCFIDEYLRRSEIVDVVGDFGAPAGDAGFEITVVNNEILIGPGRYYVAGLLCDNPASCSYDNQPFLIDPTYSGTELLAEVASARGADVLQVYLEMWQRLVTELDDPCLREPALGQADTTARLQTVWRVIAQLTPTQNPPVHAAGPPGMTPCCQQMYAGTSQPSTGAMSATTGGPSADCGCEPVAAAGYQGIENQLYRVEIHTPGDETTATFKWSRENGSVVAAITRICGSTLQLNTLGPDANLGFQAQQWVELSDDTYLFGDDPNKPGTLYQIQSIQPADLSVTLTSPVTGIDASRNARIRRWDQSGPSAGTAGIALSAGSPLQLENGIQIQFHPGNYHSGDYWTIPARTASGQIDWPPCGSDGNAFQPPFSTRVYRAPLACIHWGFSRRQKSPITWDDCRQLFNPLTHRPPALHITNISWANDSVMTADQLVANGLIVTLDQAPASPVTGANFIVTVEPAYSLQAVAQRGSSLTPSSTFTRIPWIIDTEISVSGQTLSWQLPQAILATLNELLSQGAAAGALARVRVKLLGQMIFATGAPETLYLDGRAFGELAGQGSPQQISLQLPSGEDAVASDFDSWFYLGPTLQIISLTVSPAAVFVVIDDNNNLEGVSDQENGAVVPPPAATATVTVNYPATATINLTLKADNATYQTGYVSIPATAALGGQITCSFPIEVLGNPLDPKGLGTRAIFAITASLSPAVGPPSSQSATFTVTGVTPHPIIQ
jgi:hypothetical protein